MEESKAVERSAICLKPELCTLSLMPQTLNTKARTLNSKPRILHAGAGAVSGARSRGGCGGERCGVAVSRRTRRRRGASHPFLMSEVPL